jgi:hypothetical protein
MGNPFPIGWIGILMAAVSDESATEAAKSETPIPKVEQKALRIGDRITFRVDEQGISLYRVDRTESDPPSERLPTRRSDNP